MNFQRDSSAFTLCPPWLKAAAALGFVLIAAVTTSAAADGRLIEAIKQKDIQLVRSLVKQRVDVNAPQGDGTTALHWAVRVDSLDIADALLRAGAKAGAVNDN